MSSRDWHGRLRLEPAQTTSARPRADHSSHATDLHSSYGEARHFDIGRGSVPVMVARTDAGLSLITARHGASGSAPPGGEPMSACSQSACARPRLNALLCGLAILLVCQTACPFAQAEPKFPI